MQETFSVVVTGVGGQGILLVSKVIAAAAFLQYPLACRTETRGLSQRGGAVCSFVRFGSRAAAPVVGRESADLVLSLDVLEGARALPFLKPNGRMISNAALLPPACLLDSWQRKSAEGDPRTVYARHLRQILEDHGNVRCLDLDALAGRAGCPRGLNSVLLGAAGHFLNLAVEPLRAALASAMKPQFRDANLAAFDLGRQAVQAPAMEVGRASEAVA